MRQLTGTLCVFAKPPVPGRVKTRLAPALGLQRAADLARAFLDDTLRHLSSLDHAVVVATTDPGHPEHAGTEAWDQGSGDLGARIEQICRRALADHDWVLCLGADSPGLPLDEVRQAIRLLHQHDAVIGPSTDGGYWLLGLRSCEHGLLADLPWSQSDTGAATVARLEARGLRVAHVGTWFDVDTPDDLAELRRRLPTLDAPATTRFLSEPPPPASA